MMDLVPEYQVRNVGAIVRYAKLQPELLIMLAAEK